MRARVAAPLFAAVAVSALACGGRVGSPLTVPPDGGTNLIMQADGATCVEIEAASYDTSCNVDSDCIGIDVGELCEGTCYGCVPNTAVNVSGQARYEAATAPISSDVACSCPASNAPRCVDNACILCPYGPDQPPGCMVRTEDAGGDDSDSGVTGDDSGDDSDGGFTNDAGVECVDIDLSSYDTSCTTNSDCTVIQAGQVCDGSCDCGGSPVNVDGEATYEQAVSGIVFAACPCADGIPPACVGNVCTPCSGSTTDPPECGDEGG